MNDMNELSLTTWNQERQGGPRPAWAEVGPASLPDCHRSTGSRSCFFRCVGLCEGFRVGVVMREPTNQTGITAAVAGTGPQPRFEEQDRASQVSARLIRNGQSHHAMRVEFPARFFSCNDSVRSTHYSRILGGCQVHRRRCYTNSQ